jgi:hypothetical protein
LRARDQTFFYAPLEFPDVPVAMRVDMPRARSPRIRVALKGGVVSW